MTRVGWFVGVRDARVIETCMVRESQPLMSIPGASCETLEIAKHIAGPCDVGVLDHDLEPHGHRRVRKPCLEDGKVGICGWLTLAKTRTHSGSVQDGRVQSRQAGTAI